MVSISAEVSHCTRSWRQGNLRKAGQSTSGVCVGLVLKSIMHSRLHKFVVMTPVKAVIGCASNKEMYFMGSNKFAKFDLVLRKCSGIQIRLISLMAVFLIATADIAVGYEIAIAIFLILPIAITTWYISHRDGLIFSIFCAIIWFLIDTIFSGHVYINPAAPYWNTAARLGFFLIIEGLLNQLKIHLAIEKEMARTDIMTGLLNVRGFTLQAENLFGLAARHNRSVVLAYMDLDNFKKVNDEFGHSEGDRVLQVVGEKILSSLRVTDVAARLGGDEFAIILPETDEMGAKAVFDKLRGDLLHEMQKYNWPIGFSIGVVSFDAPVNNLDEAIRIADSLMYQVKKGGKNSVIFEHYPARETICRPDAASQSQSR